MAKGRMAGIQEAIINLIGDAIDKIAGQQRAPEPVPVRVDLTPDRRRKNGNLKLQWPTSRSKRAV